MAEGARKLRRINGLQTSLRRSPLSVIATMAFVQVVQALARAPLNFPT